jgi:hypothetical protein
MIIDPFDEEKRRVNAGHSPQMMIAIFSSCFLFDLKEVSGVLSFVLPEEK